MISYKPYRSELSALAYYFVRILRFPLEHGDWEVELEESLESSESNRSLSTVNCQLSTDLLVGATVRTITGLIGVIKHIFPAHLMEKSIVVLIGEARLRFAADELLRLQK
jgi:hypothetical protein